MDASNQKESENNTEDEEKDISYHKYNLYQQFFIVGIDPKIMYNINEIDLKNVPEPLSLPKVISKYPNTNLPYLNIPDTLIASHCFPQGIINALVDYEEKDLHEKEKKIENFIFSLENMYPEMKICSLRTNKVYYTCLLFYENIENYRICINHRKFYKSSNINNTEIRNKGLLIPKVICLSSFSPYYEQTKSILHRIKNYVDNYNFNNKSTDNINIYPIEKIIEGLIFTLPAIPKGNASIKLDKDTFSFNWKLNDENPNNDSTLEKIDTIGSFESEMKEILFKETPPNRLPRRIINYSILMNYFRIEEIYEVIKFIILEEPILFFSENKEVLTNVILGLVSLIYPLQYPYPVITILPEQNFPLISLFKHFVFGINAKYSEEFLTKKIILDGVKFIRIVKLEKRFNNIINSEEKDKLGNSIFTYLKADENKPLIIIEEVGGNSYEKDKIDSKNINDAKVVNLPRHYFEKCARKLEKDTLEKFKEIQYKNKSKKVNDKEKENIFNYEIIDNILYFFSCILLRYQEFCVKYEKKIYEDKDKDGNVVAKEFGERNINLDEKYYMGNVELSDMFDCKKFIDSIPLLDRPFYKVFFKTKIFYNFIYKKIFPESNQDKLDVLYFDEIINKKLARESRMQKIDTKFLDYDYENMVDVVKINSLKREINPFFNKFLQKRENRNKALNYFQYISNLDEDYNIMGDKTLIEQKDQFYFYYYVFPILLNDGIFYNENEENKKCPYRNSEFFSKCLISNRLFNDFEEESASIIEDDEINKNYKLYDYSLNPTSQFHFKNEYLIKMLWFRYFSKIFHTIPFSKKKYYFEIMMLFLKKYKNMIDERTILILFDCINKYGDRNMNQEYFMNIKNKTYTLYLCLREKTKPENNFIKYTIIQENNNIETPNNANSTNNVVSFNSSSNNFNQKNTETKTNLSNQKDIIIEDKKLMTFNIHSYCKGKKDELNVYSSSNPSSQANTDSEDNICNEPLNEKISALYSDSDEYIQIKCNHCFKDQRLPISCEYIDEDNQEKFIIDFDLLSPMGLLKQNWFLNNSELDPRVICEEYLECYLSAIFYFYEQDLPCEFLMPSINKENELKEIRNLSYSNINSQDIYDEKCIDKKIVYENTKKEEEEMLNNNVTLLEGEGEDDIGKRQLNKLIISKDTDSNKEKNKIRESCLKKNRSPKKRNVEFKLDKEKK